MLHSSKPALAAPPVTTLVVSGQDFHRQAKRSPETDQNILKTMLQPSLSSHVNSSLKQVLGRAAPPPTAALLRYRDKRN